ncbi:hypothetical protein ACW9UR_06590 [Halovulum sp. GXIMD14794]
MTDQMTAVSPRPARLPVALIWAATLGIFAALFVAEDFSPDQPREAIEVRILWINAITHAIGGALVAWLLYGLFARSGIVGMLLALLGAVLVTLIGGLIGGALDAVVGQVLGSGGAALSAIRIGVGAITVPFAVAEQPASGLGWLAATVLSYFLARRSAG